VITSGLSKQTFYGFCLPQFYSDRSNKNAAYDPFGGSFSGPHNTPVLPLRRFHGIEARPGPYFSSVLIFYTILLIKTIAKNSRAIIRKRIIKTHRSATSGIHFNTARNPDRVRRSTLKDGGSSWLK
jgi:hypothetical protein